MRRWLRSVGVLRRYQVFRLLLDEERGRFLLCHTGDHGAVQHLFPTEDHAADSGERNGDELERVANEISERSETVKDAPLDLFHPSEAALEKGDGLLLRNASCHRSYQGRMA